jgi:hypothetical protein
VTHDVVLRITIGALALFTAGAVTVIAARYLVATWRNDRTAPGRILARHVAEVSLGTDLLVIGFAWAMRAQLYGSRIPAEVGITIRLWMYLVGMTLLLAGVLDIGRYQRRVRRYSHADPTN